MGGQLRFHHLDVTSLEFAELVGLRRPDVLYHFALLAPHASENSSVMRAVPMLLSVLEAARNHGVKKVIVSIAAGLIYGEVNAKHLPVKEGRKNDAIGVPHVMAQTLIDLLGVYREKHGIEFTVLATTNVYGLRQRAEDGVVAAFAAAIVRGEDAQIFGNGKQTRDFVYVDDVVDALVRAQNRGDGLVINIGTGVQTSVEELFKQLAAGTTVKARKISARPADLQRTAVSNVRAKIQLGWTPWTTLHDGLGVIRQHFKQQ
jgi:UDP-glucose 4-epimerase